MPIRILLADDHTIMRQELRQILENEADFAIVAEAGKNSAGDELIQAVHEVRRGATFLALRWRKSFETGTRICT